MGRILKGPRPGRRIMPCEVHDAHREAETRLATARDEAARLVASAADVREQARREGFAAGREEARAEATALLLQAQTAAAAVRERSAGDLRRLAVRIAEKILDRALELDPELVTAITAAALEPVRDRHAITLRVHPDDLAAVTQAQPELHRRLSQASALLVRADTAIGRGGCIVETEIGTVDAQLATQLAAIERALVDEAP
jgi:flagellar biosynthesis/type III secretory pathway protein FliH